MSASETNMTDIYRCFERGNEGEECQWRIGLSYAPLILFWLGLPGIYWKYQRGTRQRYANPFRQQIRMIIPVMTALVTATSALFQDGSDISLILVEVFGAITLAAIGASLELYRRNRVPTQAAIYLSLLFLTLFRGTYLILKSFESSYDSFLTVQVALLMAETILLSLSDKDAQEDEKKKVCPEQESSLLGKLLFSWMSPLVSLGAKRTLEFEDLYPSRKDCTSSAQMPKWEQKWHEAQHAQQEENQRNSTHEPTSVVQPFAKCHARLILGITICRMIADMIHFLNPLLLKLLIDFVSQPTGSISFGIGLACMMFISAETRSFLQNYQVYGMFRLTVYLQTVLTNTIMKKTLRLSPSARGNKTSGEILNLAAVDVEKMISAVPFLQNCWSVPFQICLAMTLLWITIGPAALAGILTMILFIPINYYSSQYIKRKQMRQMKIKDERTKMSNELLNGLKVIKLYAWEETFEERVKSLRREEVNMMKWINMVVLVVAAANAAAPFLVAMASFSSFMLLNEPSALSPAIAFVSIAIFNQIRQPLRVLGMLVNNLVQAMVSNRRVKTFLALEEIDDSCVGSETDGAALSVREATLNWTGKGNAAALHDLSLTIQPNEMVAIVGTVGSGKSSLLTAFLGEMHSLSGTINKQGTVAYVPQQPWIFNKTLRENILYGNVYDKFQYDKVVYACALKRDFSMFAAGDLTEVGENGVNISGGQKARIGLARALYQNRDIYLLDDPLSAVDAHVGRAVFDRVLGPKGMLANRTRVLVTHGLHYTKTADNILVMRDGAITQSGTYEQLCNEEGLFHDLIKENKNEEEEEPISSEQPHQIMRSTSLVGSVTSEKSTPEGIQLIKKEQMQTGRVKSSVYWLYFQSMGLYNSIGFFFFFILHYAFMILRSLWLSDWSNQNTVHKRINDTTTVSTRLLVYGSFGGMEIVMICIAFVFLIWGSVKASLDLHHPLIRALLRAPITFFDITPIGRIMNRISKDLEIVDNLSFSLRNMTQSLLHVSMIFFLVSYSIPAFILIAVPLLATYVMLMRYFIPTVRQLKRMESVTRSPILSLFGESIQGASSIRAFDKTAATNLQMELYVDRFIQCKYLTISVNRWLATRLELLGNTVVLSAAVLGTISARYFELSPGMVGLSVSYALSITEVLNIAVRMMGEMETNIVSVERVKEYHALESEDQWERKPEPCVDWPAKGSIKISDYKMRYRDGLPLVLNGVTAEIQPGHKVAVIGRTGSGKSSLTMGLFRMIEAAGGSMEIDDVRIDRVGLHQLRRKIAIIPQDPVLFSGTLRFNLDPFDEYSDEQIWSTLEKCQLYAFATEHAEGLQFQLNEGGKNMSVGERQLVCLGRALLRGGRILVLDEATAAVDTATDALVQTVVRKYFPQATVIAIAHRLDTVADYDRIMVMDNGHVVEYDTPQRLLENPKSQYSQMVEKSKNM